MPPHEEVYCGVPRRPENCGGGILFLRVLPPSMGVEERYRGLLPFPGPS